MTHEQTDKLYDHHRQQLSAMLDGELPPDQAKFMLRRLEHDRELAACWERWQVCGDVLRGRHEALLPADFSRRVADAIAGQDHAAAASIAPAGAGRRPRWARWGGGAALAASVAMAALFVGRQAPESATGPAPSRVVAATTAQDAVASATDPAGTTPTAPKPAPAPDAGTTLATAAVAVAEVPRRAAERRSSRAQQQRAASRIRHDAGAQAPAMVAAASPGDAMQPATPQARVAATGLADAGAAPLVTDLFTAQPQAPSRPWPRAILPGYPAEGALTASYGSLDGSAPAHPFHPFEPRLELPPQPDDAPTPPASGPR